MKTSLIKKSLVSRSVRPQEFHIRSQVKEDLDLLIHLAAQEQQVQLVQQKKNQKLLTHHNLQVGQIRYKPWSKMAMER